MAKLGCGLMNGEYSIEPNDTMPISNEEQAGHVSIFSTNFSIAYPGWSGPWKCKMDFPHLSIVDILGQSRKWYKTSYV